eukprot:jgi/Bigna1/74371/fgenesh1_pg.28_\
MTDKATLIGLMLVALFMLIVFIVTATRKAPVIMGNSLRFHGIDIENPKIGFGVLFANDSPFQIGHEYPRIAAFLIFLFVLYVNYWERALARRALGSRRLSRQMLNRFPSANFSPDLVDSARAKLRKVQDNLKRLDYKFAAFKTWMQQDILKRERRIVGILSTASSDELNYILTNVNLPLLFYKIKDNDLLTPARLLASRQQDFAPPPLLKAADKIGGVGVKQGGNGDENDDLSKAVDGDGAHAAADPVVIANIVAADAPSKPPPPKELKKHSFGSDDDDHHHHYGSSITPDISPMLIPITTRADVKMASLKLASAIMKEENCDYEKDNHDDEEGGESDVVDQKLYYQKMSTTLEQRENERYEEEKEEEKGYYNGGMEVKEEAKGLLAVCKAATTTLGSPPPPIDVTNRVLLGEYHMEGRGGGSSSSSKAPRPPPSSSVGGNFAAAIALGEFEQEAGGAKAIVSVRNRTQVLNLVAEERLPELKLEARALVILALQNMPIRKQYRFFHSFGILNSRMSTFEGFGNSLGVLQYRKEIKRLRTSSPLASSSSSSSSSSFPQNVEMRPTLRKILSDVDDTLFSSGGRFPAGIDATYKHHELYPGVLAFYKELDLAFLSARPHVYKDWSQAKSYKLFSQLKKSHNLHTTPTLLAGELFSSFQMFRGDFNPMAHKKAQNFFEYSSLYPEYKFVFIGDNGQGDVIAAEMILEKYSERLEGVFIHKVQKLARTPGYTDKSRAKWDDLGIMFFRTYIGASLLACKKNLISIRGLRQVASNAVKDFCKIEFSKEETRFARLQELNRDIEKCNDYLQSQGYPTVAYVAAKHVFARGTMVSTRRYGYGRVLEFRHDDDEE